MSRGKSPKRYPRTARVNEVLREVVAEELERIDDERLGITTVTAVEVDPDLRHAVVWLSSTMIAAQPFTEPFLEDRILPRCSRRIAD